jgi:hypothetical protein
MELKSKTTFRRDQKGGPFKSTQKTTIIKKTNTECMHDYKYNFKTIYRTDKS